jgi:hypothetical protein
MRTKIIVSSIIIVIVVILINVIPQCSDRERPVQRSESEIRSFLTDSITTANKEAENLRLDSLKQLYSTVTNKATTDAHYWHYEAINRGRAGEKYRHIADSISRQNLPQCRDVITAFRIALDSADSTNDALVEENKALNVEAEGYSQQLYIERKQSLNKDTIIMSKVYRIQSLEADNERLQCYGNHRFKSWFWKWLSGQKKCE